MHNTQEVKKELETVFERRYKNTTLTHADAYFKTDVSDDFFTVNAEGIVQNKRAQLADKERLRKLEVLDFEFFDQYIKIYDHVGIIKGSIQAYSEATYVGEIFYTAIVVKYGDTCKCENWHGTLTKDCPQPPSFGTEN